MHYKTKREFMQAYNACMHDECAEDIRRYGVHITRNDYEVTEGYYKGCNAWIIAEYHGHRWAIHYVAGKVTQLYWTARFD